MSLGVLIKGPEGVVLAADSRVTLFNQMPNPQGQTLLFPVTFDNATKLLRANGQDFVGAVTYGLGAMITPEGPRTIHSFIPEFEAELREKEEPREKKERGERAARLSVKQFADRLSAFFVGRWDALINRPANPGEDINFIVGGYDENSAYGRVFTFVVPNAPAPIEQHAGPGQFGITWGGQQDLVGRLLFGFDMSLLAFLQSELKMAEPQFTALVQKMQAAFAAGIPYQALPLQDCVDLAVFLVKSTIDFQKFRVVLRGVGGPVEVATITGVGGFQFVAQKKIHD